MALPEFGSSWRNYDFSGGTTPVDYIAQGPPAASKSGGFLGMDPLTATAGLGLVSVLGQGIFDGMVPGKEASAARATAKMANERAKEQLRAQKQFAGAQLGAQNLFADLDFARQGIAYDFQNQYNAFNPAARTNFRRAMQGNMLASGASPGRIALAGKLMGFT
jgi:hypothetical protein